VMKSSLPMTGTNELLARLDPYVPDTFINEGWSVRPPRGPRRSFSAAQLWRTHLLMLLTPAHSLNQLQRLLTEQRAWRSFARLPHRERVPDVRMLNEFRWRVGVSGLRCINDHLRQPLIERARNWSHAVALIDATDLEASSDGFKKKRRRPIRRTGPQWGSAPSRPGRADGMSVTKSIPCVYGGESRSHPCFWCR